MIVAHCAPPGCPWDRYAEMMRGRSIMKNFITCPAMQIPEGLVSLDLDSGAFQAWRHGTTINPEALAKWYERHDTARLKMSLDVIGGTEEQQKAGIYTMERLGQTVTPVFHGPHCESWEWFDELCERYPVVAIGSVLADNTSADATEWLNQVFDRVCDRETGTPRVEIHGLRMASRIQDFPFASVDGSTWVRASRNGNGPSARGGQVPRPWMSCLELQKDWIRYYDWAPKCERHIPRAARTMTARIMVPDVGQGSLFSEAS